MLYVVFPSIYLFIAFAVELELRSGGEYDMMMYILLIVSVFLPAISPLPEKFQIAEFKKKALTIELVANLWVTINVLRAAFVENVFIFGVVVFFLSGDITRMLYFYPIGIVWTIIRWPRVESLESFVKKVTQ